MVTKRMNTESIRGAAKVLREATEHFDQKTKDLVRVSDELSQGTVLVGGFGGSGAAQREIANFAKAWGEKFSELLQDEMDFVIFLDTMSVRLHDAAGLYDEAEAANVGEVSALEHELEQGK